MTFAKTQQRVSSGIIYVGLAIGAIAMLVPFYWTLITSIKIPSETITYPPIWIPSQITFKWFGQAWHANFPIYYRNSTIVAVAVLVGNVLTSALAGFIFAKYQFRGKNALFLLVLATMMVPFAVLLIPLYFVVVQFLGLKDTLWAMILPALVSPFGIFLMRQFIESIPDELIDAMRIDGASDMRIFVQLILPLCKPALAALAIFHFIWIWNDFLWPLIVTDSDKSRTLPIGVVMFALPRWQQFNLVVAASVLVLLPMLIFYLIFQRQFVEGVVLTGLKY